MKPFNEEEFLRDKARALSSGLFLRLDEFVNEFPGGAPGRLISLIKLFLKEIDSQLIVTSSKKILWGYFYLIEELSKSLDWLDNAHTAQTPRGLVQLLEAIASTLHPEAILLVAPTTENNYSIIDLIPYYTTLAEDSLSAKPDDALLQSLPKFLYLIRFPRIERENILNQAIFGHEFGHPVADEFITSQEQQPEYAMRLQQLTQKIQSDTDLADELAEATDNLGRSKLLSEFVDDVQKIHRRALEELVSDTVGIYLFGPSALFASLDAHLQGSLDDEPSDPEYFPPARFRLRLMVETLEADEHIETIRLLDLPQHLTHVQACVLAVFDHLAGIISKNDDQDSIKINPLVRIAYEWVNETLPQALEYAKSRVSTLIYLSAAAKKDLTGLLERLAVDVPPNEVGAWPEMRPADWRSSMLASWMTMISKILDHTSPPEERAKQVKIVQKLALTGIEYALLQERYLRFKGQGIKG